MKKTDQQLQQDVMAELEMEPRVDHADIGVAVHDGVVTLSGYVTSYPQKAAAEEATRRVVGVTAIAEEIKVRFASDPKTADHEIAKRIIDLFAWNVLIPKDRINVKVERGWVTLTGTVDETYQRNEARRAAGRITGVLGVSDLMSLKTAPDASDVKERIMAAFRRQANLDGQAVKVVTDGGKVRLTGRVSHWAERSIAERAARAAPGVVEVEDNLLVTI